MMGNDIVLQLVKIFDQTTRSFVSSTLAYALQYKLNSEQFNWKTIGVGIITGILHMHGLKVLHNDLKENNVLLAETRGLMISNICDFGKSTLICSGTVYNLNVQQKKIYNERHRHIAYQLRNLMGFKQSPATDAFSTATGHILKQIGYVVQAGYSHFQSCMSTESR